MHMEGIPCLVVGGGRVGLRKARGLLSAGARVVVVEPAPCSELIRMARDGLLELRSRFFEAGDLEGMRLVFAATHNAAANAMVARESRSHGIFCNIADDPSGSDFFLPALVQRGDLTLAISTGGRSPALARKLRMDLEACFDEGYQPFLEIMGRVRQYLLAREHNPDRHRDIFRFLVEGPLLSHIRNRDRQAMVRLLSPFVGDGAEELVFSVIRDNDVRNAPENSERHRKEEDS
nr:bifunctional precorrin-2 dehydrogenase/sirohydrochlorin ferrochelatase [Desulfobotulus pelophilus]